MKNPGARHMLEKQLEEKEEEELKFMLSSRVTLQKQR